MTTSPSKEATPTSDVKAPESAMSVFTEKEQKVTSPLPFPFTQQLSRTKTTNAPYLAHHCRLLLPQERRAPNRL